MSGVWRRGAAALVLVSSLAASGCALVPKGKVAEAEPCRDLRVSIYFDKDSAVLTKEAKSVLGEAAGMRKGCPVGVVHVLGLADAQGAPDANLELSEARAKAVTAALGGLGFGNVAFDAKGDAGAVTSAGEANPMRRRAEVVFHARDH